MAHPKRKHSNERTRLRRSQDRLRNQFGVHCTQYPEGTKEYYECPRRPHQVCPKCGYYDGKQVITIKQKEDKKK